MSGVVALSQKDAKTELVRLFSERAEELAALAISGGDLREAEKNIAKEMFSLGRAAMSTAYALRCLAATQRDLQERGLKPGQIRMRFDQDYFATATTTMGAVSFPLFAYREERAGATVTRTPARVVVLPYHSRCHSSPLCLEWESRLGADHPFRKAQEELSFVTHDSRDPDIGRRGHDTRIAGFCSLGFGNLNEYSGPFRRAGKKCVTKGCGRPLLQN